MRPCVCVRHESCSTSHLSRVRTGDLEVQVERVLHVAHCQLLRSSSSSSRSSSQAAGSVARVHGRCARAMAGWLPAPWLSCGARCSGRPLQHPPSQP